MKDEKILNLIKFIVCYATDHGVHLTAIRLVKYIYLADLYHARCFNGETLTKLPWAFVHFGPYCSRVMEYIDEAVNVGFITRTSYESNFSNKDYQLYTCNDEDYDQIKRSFPREIISELQFMIKKYGDNTAQLLDYVYFGTEPMMEVKKGDRLDFSRAVSQLPQTTDHISKISHADIARIKECIKQLREKLSMGKDNLAKDDRETDRWKDDVYYEALDSINQDDTIQTIEGNAKIIL